MGKKKAIGWLECLCKLAAVIPSVYNIFSHYIYCLARELKAQRDNIVLLLALLICAAVVMQGLWVGICILLFIFLTNLGVSMLSAMTAILIINLIFLFILILLIKVVKNKIDLLVMFD